MSGDPIWYFAVGPVTAILVLILATVALRFLAMTVYNVLPEAWQEFIRKFGDAKYDKRG